jgi:ribosome-binding protein aMBF1 (putative translation factor)
MDSNIQDWEPRVLRKPTNATATGHHKPKVSHIPSSTKTTYDEEGNEIIKLKTVSNDMAQFIVKARLEKGLKQIDLARQANVDAKTMGEIERGGCVYNAGQINKIAKALGITIPRK